MTAIAAWLDQHQVSLFSVVMTLAFIVAAAIVILLLSRLIQKWLTYLQSRTHFTDETTILTARVVTGALWIVALMLVLDIWGISFGGVWTLLVSTITLIGIGFLATWTLISNFTASLFLTTLASIPSRSDGRNTS